MTLDPRLPVLIGVGEAVHRPGGEGPTSPPALAAQAVRAALADAGLTEAALSRFRVLAGVPSAGWPDGDPALAVAGELGLVVNDVHTLRSSMQGGNGPNLLLATLGERIQQGRLDAAILCGAESLSTVATLMKRGEAPDWASADAYRRPSEVLEEDRAAATDAETAVGMIAPIMAYPLIENALRAASGRSAGDHLELISRVWSRFSEVAARQPAAWSPRVRSSAELSTPSPGNRQVTLPYLKELNANIQVDQGAALLVCSVATARSLGVAAERWVFLHAGAQARDEWFLSERTALHRSPAIAAAGRALLGHAGTEIAEVGPVDLYSCFPAAVGLAARELGLPLDDPGRPLTCTGGLTFFGGAGNNYATHGIAAIARMLRQAEPGTLGLSTALGWYATKHALALLGSAPPPRPFTALAPEVPPARREVAPAQDIAAHAETATLIYDREGRPSYGILFALLKDGRRGLAKTDDPAVMAEVAQDGFLGSEVSLRADRTFAPA